MSKPMIGKPLLLHPQSQQRLSELGLVDDEGRDGGGTDTGQVKPAGPDIPGLPKSETFEMMLEQRELEQGGHRRHAKVNTCERKDASHDGNEPGPGMKSHPYLDNQKFDGIDITDSAVPSNNPELLDEYNRKKNEQQLQNALKLGKSHDKSYSPGFMPTPRPGS